MRKFISIVENLSPQKDQSRALSALNQVFNGQDATEKNAEILRHGYESLIRNALTYGDFEDEAKLKRILKSLVDAYDYDPKKKMVTVNNQKAMIGSFIK